MAFTTRSKVFAFVEEDSEGILKDPAAENFTAVREGASLTGAVETTTSDEIRNSIGASKSFVTKEAPTGSVPKYVKPSFIEGQASDDYILYKSCLGGLIEYQTEYLTAAGSTAGDADTRAKIALADGDIVAGNFKKGQALLIKDGVNGYAVRNIVALDDSGDPDLLSMSFNFGTAPGAGVGLGKACFYETKDNAQPTFSAHEYQSASADSAVHIAEAGVRTTAMNFEFPANDLASVSFDLGGISFFQNPIRIDASNKFIDFTDSVGVKVAEIFEKVYQTPIDLAVEVASKMSAVSDDVISCVWGNKTGLFTISTDGASLSLEWASGANAGASIGVTLGYDVSADDTGALSYASDNEQTYEPPVTPEYDDSEPQIVRDNMLLLGSYDDYICFGGQNLTISVATPKTDVPNWCVPSGVDESIILSREVTVSGTLKFQKHDVERIYNLLRNETVQLSFVHGKKEADNWVPGTISTIFLPEVSVTTDQIADNDGYIVEEFEGTAIVGSELNDIYFNQL